MLHEKVLSRERIPLSREEVIGLLEYYGIEYHTWGHGATKTLEDLMAELEEGEAVLRPGSERLVRKIDGIALDVFAPIDGVMHRLVEDRQVFVANGCMRQRHLSTSLGEKIKPGEDIMATIRRALHEELGIELDEQQVTIGESTREYVEAAGFPGLLTDRGLTHAAVVLAADQIRREGYVEHRPGKDSFFVWQLLR